MQVSRRNGDLDELTALSDAQTQVLTASEERQLLRELAECKQKLTDALNSIPGGKNEDGEDAQSLSDRLLSAAANDGLQGARLGAIACRFKELRGRLALANTRLVAHVAKQFRDRGISYSDLLQEGMCGLLEAIDRFDLGRETKLATYATWWIRQSMQRPSPPVPIPSGSVEALATACAEPGGRHDRGRSQPERRPRLRRPDPPHPHGHAAGDLAGRPLRQFQ